jgi:hypothetical protein
VANGADGIMADTNALAGGQPISEAFAQCCRAWVRYAPRQETPCHLMTLNEHERWPARVQNLSSNGVGLLLQERVDVSRFVLVELVSPSGLFSRLLLTRVIHLSETGDGYLLGGEFISELPGSELRFLLT